MKRTQLLILAYLLSGNSFAKCDSTPQDFPGKVPPNYYGNGQTDSFRCAITGSTNLSLSQQAERADLIPEKLGDRFYIRIGANAGSEAITSVKNKSFLDTTLERAKINSTSIKTATNNIELGIGYTWAEFAVDIEWLAIKSINYNASLTGINPNIDFSTKVKGDAVMGNLYWIFNDLYNFKFYGIACLGLSSNESIASFTGSTPTVIKKKSPAFGAGVGARFSLISKLYADMAIRYIVLGKVKFEASNGLGRYMTLTASRNWIGVSARLLWLI